MPDYLVLEILCNTLNFSINDLYYAKKISDIDYKNISEDNLREKYRKYYLIKNMIYGVIFCILIYAIVY